MSRKILMGLILIIPSLGLSQSDFRKGYIITQKQDTVFGYINYRESDKAFETCEFKKSQEEESAAYTSEQIVAYGFLGDKFFASKSIKKKDETYETVFLEVLVRGMVSLYKFKDTFWVEKEGQQTIYPLTNEGKEVYMDGKTVIKYSNLHIGTLNMLLFDCEEMKSSHLKKIALSERPLANLIEEYNKCKGAAVKIFKEKKPWAKSMIGVTAGINFSQLSFNTDYQEFDYLLGDFEVSKTPMIGVAYEFFSPRISERFSFNVTGLYLKSTYYNHGLIETSSSAERNYVTIELQQLKVPFGIRYTFPERKFTPYANLGISYAFHMKSSSQWVQELESFNNNYVLTYTNDALEIKNRQLGFWGGVGMLRSVGNKLTAFLEIRYEQTDGIAPYLINNEILKSKVTNFQITFGIRTK